MAFTETEWKKRVDMLKIKTSERLEGIGEYYFSQKLREIEELNKAGKQIINLGIGSPDLPPHPDVIRVLQEEAAKPSAHGYQSYKGSPMLREAMSRWYKTWYRTELDPQTEILPLLGSKEGIMHICMTYLQKGDEVLIPDPGYPTYRSAVQLAGGTVREYMLLEENQWFPDLQALEEQGLDGVKMMWVNYPHMPSGSLPTRDFFERLVAFGKRNNILICHDNPYSFILNDEPMSLLSVPGAKDVVIELNSLSKAQNMAGWRVGMIAGAAARIQEILTFKSNMDSGMFLPVQLAAVKALELGREWYDDLNRTYRERREEVFRIMDLLGARCDRNQCGLFVWAHMPSGHGNCYEWCDELLHQAGVFITPGAIFGQAGKRYIRISLCSTKERIMESFNRLQTYLSSKSNG
jgi:aspartate/methionine/tyrosine aminotransferase